MSKITKETKLEYDYFSDETILLNGTNCFYYESHNSLDRYQIMDLNTSKVIVCSENKELLLDYLINQDAEITKQ